MTIPEMRDTFLGQVRVMLHYWARVNLGPEVAAEIAAHGPAGEVIHRMEGLVHSILVILDGCSSLPAFDLSPSPHASDEAFARENGENWWVKGAVINEASLHDLWYRK